LHHWGIGPRPERIEIVVPRGQRQQRPAVRVIQSTDIIPVDITAHRGLPTSTPVRALIDAARFLSPLALSQSISASIKANLVEIDQLTQRFLEVARRGRHGVRKMRACLATFGADPEATVFEKDLERIITRDGFVPPVRQFPVKTNRKVYFLDHAWPELKKWSECDSMLAHGSAEDLRKDLERQNRIIATTGFEPMRFTYFDVHQRPDYVTEILARHLPKR
jgi:very-short-patch-repair endonuclease